MANSAEQVGNCSFHDRVKSECGPSRGRSAIAKLSDCQRNLNRHLASSHLKRDLSEHEVILARVGIFQCSDTLLQNMSICPRHRDSLGQFWRGPASCRYPAHGGKRRRVHDTHVVNSQMAQEIIQIYGVVVEIGSRKH